MKKLFLLLLILFYHFGLTQNFNQLDSLETKIKMNFYIIDQDSLLLLIKNYKSKAKLSQIPKHKVLSNKYLGDYFYKNGDYDTALTYFHKALHENEIKKDSIIESKIYNNISLILNANKQFEKSLTYKLKALQFSNPKNDYRWHNILLHNIGYTYALLGNSKEFNNYIDEAFKSSKKYNDSTSIATIYNTLSLNFLKNKNYKKAIIYADSVQNQYKKFIQKSMYENSLFYSSKSLFELKEYDLALLKLKESTESALNDGFIVNASENYQFMSEIYLAQNKPILAIDALKKAITFKDSIFGLEKQKAVLELEEKYQNEKKEKENLILKKETAEKDLKIVEKNNIILLISLVFGILIISLFVYQILKMKSKNVELSKSIERRIKLESELEEVRDNIAKDFHDDLGNKLARITTLSDLMITTADKRDKNQIITALHKIKEDSNILYQGTRDFMFSLKSKSDLIEETFLYIIDFGQEYLESFDIDLLVTKELEKNIKLPYYWNRQIILIFKEAMTNVVKHSKASKAILKLSLLNNKILITLKDNGIGIDTNVIGDKNGLINMRKRAERINGNLIIDSNNYGTQILFESTLPEMGSTS